MEVEVGIFSIQKWYGVDIVPMLPVRRCGKKSSQSGTEFGNAWLGRGLPLTAWSKNFGKVGFMIEGCLCAIVSFNTGDEQGEDKNRKFSPALEWSCFLHRIKTIELFGL